MIIKQFRRKIFENFTQILKNFREMYKTNDTLVKINEILDI